LQANAGNWLLSTDGFSVSWSSVSSSLFYLLYQLSSFTVTPLQCFTVAFFSFFCSTSFSNLVKIYL
jgi:hypothetical protein